MKYKHTQIGRLMIFVLLALIVYFGFLLTQIGMDPTTIAIMILVILIIISFSTLTVTINEKYLKIKFGYGIYKRQFLLKEITSAKTVKNHWYYGWGIRLWLWPRMWIFNVSGFDAVEIKLQNGKIYRIGTDEPMNLKNALLNEIINK